MVQVPPAKVIGNGDDVDAFRDWYSSTLSWRLENEYHAREAYWSEAFAVGDADWISKLYKEFDFKRKKIGFAKDLPTKVDEESSIYYIEG